MYPEEVKMSVISGSQKSGERTVIGSGRRIVAVVDAAEG